MRPEFLSQQAEMLKAVIDDSVRLQDMSRTSFSDVSTVVPHLQSRRRLMLRIYHQLTSLGETFVLNMVNNIRDVVTDVATAFPSSTVPPSKVRESVSSLVPG